MQVDQDQAHGIGRPHVAEGLIGDLPFPIPLDGVLAVRVARLANPVLGQHTLAGQGGGQAATNGKQPVQG